MGTSQVVGDDDAKKNNAICDGFTLGRTISHFQVEIPVARPSHASAGFLVSAAKFFFAKSIQNNIFLFRQPSSTSILPDKNREAKQAQT